MLNWLILYREPAVKLDERWDFIETAIMESERIDSVVRYSGV